uniref:Uncharacterized protein n=1 Tax=Meloidogyne hapla TaxID=6305 RepID=A0A1I8BUH2_MELHA
MNSILGHKMFIPLSKITLLMFFAAVFCVYGCALLLSLAMEVPVAHIDKLLFGPGGGGSQRLQSTARSNTSDKSGEQQQLHEGLDFENEGEEIKKEGLELNRLLINDEKIEKENIK